MKVLALALAFFALALLAWIGMQPRRRFGSAWLTVLVGLVVLALLGACLIVMFPNGWAR